MLEFLADQCTLDASIQSILNIIKTIVNWLQILIPVGLILFGTIDMGKAVIAGDEKKIKEAQKPFIKRLISAVIVFLIPFIVNLAINLFVDDATEWKACWTKAQTSYDKFDLK